MKLEWRGRIARSLSANIQARDSHCPFRHFHYVRIGMAMAPTLERCSPTSGIRLRTDINKRTGKKAKAKAATVTPTTRCGRRRTIVSFLNESRVVCGGKVRAALRVCTAGSLLLLLESEDEDGEEKGTHKLASFFAQSIRFKSTFCRVGGRANNGHLCGPDPLRQ